MHPRRRPQDKERRANAVAAPTYCVAFSLRETYDDIATARQMICNKKNNSSNNSITPTNSNSGPSESNSVRNINNDYDNTSLRFDNKYDANDDFYSMKCDEKIPPQVLFAAAKQTRPARTNKSTKKTKSRKRVTKIRNAHFKVMMTKLERYCDKAKRDAVKSGVIQHRLCNSVTKIVSRTGMLKKALTKENLLDNEASLVDILSSADTESMSSPSTVKISSVLSYASDNTLMDSSSERTASVDSVPVSDNLHAYKNEIINVAAVQIDHSHKVNETNTTVDLENLPRTVNKDDVDKTRVITTDKKVKENITSESELSSTSTMAERSDLILNKAAHISSETSSGYDTYYMAKTCSTPSAQSGDSKYTLVPASDKEESTSRLGSIGDVIKKPDILETVIDMGIFPEITPSTSNATSDRIIVADKRYKTFKSDGKKDGRNIFRHPLDSSLDPAKSMPDCLTNQPLKNTRASKPKIQLSDEFSPYNVSDLCSKLVTALDTAVMRLEETLIDRITREIKNSIASITTAAKPLIKYDVLDKIDRVEVDFADISSVVTKSVDSVVQNRKDVDACLQCNLINNNAIDELMLKIHLSTPQAAQSPKQKQANPIKDLFEVLKAPPRLALENLKVDTITISTETPAFTDDVVRRVMKFAFDGPLKFIRANLLVVVAVPAFVIVSLLFYGLLMYLVA